MTQQIIFSDIDADVTQFKEDLVTALSKNQAWKGTLTTQVGTALIDFVASLGAFNHQAILNAFENCFSETATCDDAIRSIALMQGLRMTRKMPSYIDVSLSCEVNVSIPAYSQFICAGYDYFNREVIDLTSNESKQIRLYEGTVHKAEMSGLSTELQVWSPPETNFQVSDQDVLVFINKESIPVTYSGLWNFKGLPACTDLTSMEGRLIIQFGNLMYGSLPSINDNVLITYCTTNGNAGNNYVTYDKEVSVDGFTQITGKSLTNPAGGADEKTAYTYKNNTASSFGTYGSAVTKSQYQAVVNTYPGVIDAYTQAQREIDPTDYRFMNVIRVTGITNVPWDAVKKQEFCQWCQDQSMYTTRFVWVDATPSVIDVDLELYCYNSAVLSSVKQNVEEAIKKLFAPRAGILMTDFYISDLISAARNADSGVAFVIVNSPVSEMIVTQANAPTCYFEILPEAGTLKEYFYSYGVTFIDNKGVESKKSSWIHPQTTQDNNAIKITWRKNPAAVKYRIYGRESENIGLLAEVNADTLEYTDDGSAVPDTSKYSRAKDTIIRYNSLGSLNIKAYFADRQQRVTNQILTEIPTRSSLENN